VRFSCAASDLSTATGFYFGGKVIDLLSLTKGGKLDCLVVQVLVKQY
jgi:hypothetical protein